MRENIEAMKEAALLSEKSNDTDTLEKPTRRKIVDKTVVKVDVNETILVPNIQCAMSNAVGVIAKEIIRLHSKVNRGVSLDMHESKALRDYVASLVSISKEAREASKTNDFSNLTNEELLKLAQSITKTTGE